MNIETVYKVLECLANDEDSTIVFSHFKVLKTSRDISKQINLVETVVCKALQFAEKRGYIERKKEKNQMGKISKITPFGKKAIKYYKEMLGIAKRLNPKVVEIIEKKIKEEEKIV